VQADLSILADQTRNRRVIAVGLLASIAVAATYAVAYFFQTLDEQYHYGSDNYQVLATIVADRNPGYFDADPVLADPANYRFYRTAFTVLVDWTYRWLGNPGQVYGLLAIAFNALRVFGFYLLGLRLFRSPGWALALSVAAAIEVRFNMFWEWWGIPFGTFARTAYESLFPYLLFGAINAASRLWRQAAVMLAAAAASYLHPVSGPPVAFALWAAMSAAPSEAPLAARLRNAVAAGLVFALLTLPFVLYYRANTAFGAVSFDEWAAALRTFYQPYMNLPHTLLKQLTHTNVIAIFGLGAAGLIAARRRGERLVIDFLAIFSAALAFAALFVPLVDHAVATRLGRAPLQLDFVRAAKYFTPIAVIGLLWGAKLAWENNAPSPAARWRRRALVVVAGLLCLLALNRGTLETLSQVSCDAKMQRRVSCLTQQERADATAMYRAIQREVPRGMLVFLDPGPGHPGTERLSAYGIRIYSRRPVAWSWKEGSILAYTNPAAMIEWDRRRRALQEIGKLTGEAKSSAMVRLMAQWKVRYVVLEEAALLGPVDLPGRVLYRNASATLIELATAPSSEP
jgi:hypothetical protein